MYRAADTPQKHYAATGERVTERRQEPDKENNMKLIITANTWEEEVRNAIIHIIDNGITLIEFKIYAAAIAGAIAKNDLERATQKLWIYSEKGHTQEQLRDLINDLRKTYERGE